MAGRRQRTIRVPGMVSTPTGRFVSPGMAMPGPRTGPMPAGVPASAGEEAPDIGMPPLLPGEGEEPEIPYAPPSPGLTVPPMHPAYAELMNMYANPPQAPHPGILRTLLGNFLGGEEGTVGGMITGQTQYGRAVRDWLAKSGGLQSQLALATGLEKSQGAESAADLARRNVESQISLRGAQAGAAGAQKQAPLTPLESAFQRQYGRMPTADELVDYEAKLKRAGQPDRPEPAVEDDRKFDDITMRQSLGRPVTVEEGAWAKAYLRRKTAAAQVFSDPRWAQVDIARQRFAAPYVRDYIDAEKIDDLAKRVMRDIQDKGGNISGPEFMQLLTYHMAGTIGAVKGARTGIDMLKEHVGARPWSESLEAMYRAATQGGNVSAAQAQAWVHLAEQRRETMYRVAQGVSKLYSANLDMGAVAPQQISVAEGGTEGGAGGDLGPSDRPEGTIQTNTKTGQRRVTKGGRWQPLPAKRR